MSNAFTQPADLFPAGGRTSLIRRIVGSPEWLLALMVLAAFVALLRPSIHGNDGVRNYVYLRSLMFDGDLDFSNEYEHYFRKEAGWFDNRVLTDTRDPVTGLPANLYGVGSSLLWGPWVLAIHGCGRIASMMGVPVVLDGYSKLYEWAVSLGSCFYASVGLWLLFRTLRRLYEPDVAFWAVLGIWLGTNQAFYMYLHPSMSHANSFFLASVLLWLYLGGDGFWRWAALGAVAGLLALTRFQDAVLVVGVGVGEVFRLRDLGWRTVGQRIARYAVALVCAVLAFTPQLAAWWVLQGSPFSGPREYLAQGEVHPLAPVHAFSVLFSSWHGLLFWHPILFFALGGLLVSASLTRERCIVAAVFVAQLWVVASWSIWWAGASFGHRMFISTLPFLALGLAEALRMSRCRSVLVRVLLLCLIGWNFGYMVQYGSGMISRQKGVTLSSLAYNNVVEVPKLLLRLVTK